MSDMFEIGVSLALHDGVSASIHAARRDMQAVEAAVGRNVVAVSRLKRMAVGLPPVMPLPAPVMPKVAAPKHETNPSGGIEPTRPVDQASIAQVSMSPARNRGTTKLGVDRVAADRPVESSPEVPAAHSVAPRACTTAAEPAPRPAEYRVISNVSSAAALGASNVTSKLKAPGQHEPSSRPAVDKVPSAPATVTIANSKAALSAVESRHVQDVRFEPVAGARGAVAAARMPAESWYTAISPILSRQDPASERSESGDGATVRNDWPTPGQMPRDAAAQKIVAPATLTPAGLPDSPGTSQTPGGGDVYLDGVLVGRWLARHLAREASLSPNGPTGFDPRRNPERPGATLGVS